MSDGLGLQQGPETSRRESLLRRVRRMDTLGRAWRVMRENGRASRSIDTRREIDDFAEGAEASLTKIQRQLNHKKFTFKPAKGIAIPKKDGKSVRPLVVAPIESRIVQRAVHDVLLSVPDMQRYVENPFSFGGVRKGDQRKFGAVPAAIRAVLDAIGDGATYVIKSDISSFFTRIPKPVVTAIVAEAVKDDEFVEFFGQAISVELENLAALRENATTFPIYEIGVAQGNSLSPLLGNLLLSEFDQEMNSGTSKCFRYIDDFIILGRSEIEAERQFSLACRLLHRHGMSVSTPKTFKGPIKNGFEFLGIEMINGAVRSSKDSRRRLIENVALVLSSTEQSYRDYKNNGKLDRSKSLIRTLYEVAGIVRGWGNHYFFCNEQNVLAQLDKEIDGLIARFLGVYGIAREGADGVERRFLLGVAPLTAFTTGSFVWPKPTPQAA